MDFKLPEDLINAVMLGYDYIDRGNPLKDAMEDYQIEDLVTAVSNYFYEKGYRLESDEDEQ